MSVSDNIPIEPLADRPVGSRGTLIAITVMIAIGVAAVIVSAWSGVTASEEHDRETLRANIQAAQNEVTLLENRVRAEQGHECIARFQRDVVVAFAEGRNADALAIKPCPAEDLPALHAELAEAQAALERLQEQVDD